MNTRYTVNIDIHIDRDILYELFLQYLRNFLETVTLDTLGDQFADPLICNVIVS